MKRNLLKGEKIELLTKDIKILNVQLEGKEALIKQLDNENKNLLFSISEFCDNNNDKCVDGATSEVADYLYDKYNTTVDKILYFENKNNMFPSVHLYNSPYVLRLG